MRSCARCRQLPQAGAALSSLSKVTTPDLWKVEPLRPAPPAGNLHSDVLAGPLWGKWRPDSCTPRCWWAFCPKQTHDPQPKPCLPRRRSHSVVPANVVYFLVPFLPALAVSLGNAQGLWQQTICLEVCHPLGTLGHYWVSWTLLSEWRRSVF